MSPRSSQRRNYDTESGKNRVSSRKQKKLPPPESESDSEPVYSDSDLEQQLEMPRKDVSYRKAKQPERKTRPPRVADHGVGEDEETGAEMAKDKAKETESKVAPHMQFLLAATYHLGFSSIIRPTLSTYIPSCYNLFSMTFRICELICENTYLNEAYPGFFSVQVYTYVGFIYFYQILRAKDLVGQGQLSRNERRVLRIFKSIGEPESWPIPAPLIEFVRALGAYKSSNPVYSWVVPTFPDFGGLVTGTGTNQGFTNYHNSLNIQRVPPLPALVQFLRNMGNNTATFRNGLWIPIQAANGQLGAAHTFLGMNDSTAATGNDFQALAFSDGWNEPTESEMRQGVIQSAIKRRTMQRWSIDDVVGNLDNIEAFTRTLDNLHTAWIRNLCSMMNIVCRLFPGSTNLSAIDPVCHIGTLTRTYIDKTPTRVAVDHKWYRGRHNWTFDYHAYDDTEQGRLLARIGIATGTRNIYDAHVIPVGTIAESGTGPFFEDDVAQPIYERREVYRVEGQTSDDPVGRFAEQVSALYQPAGVRD